MSINIPPRKTLGQFLRSGKKCIPPIKEEGSIILQLFFKGGRDHIPLRKKVMLTP